MNNEYLLIIESIYLISKIATALEGKEEKGFSYSKWAQHFNYFKIILSRVQFSSLTTFLWDFVKILVWLTKCVVKTCLT